MTPIKYTNYGIGYYCSDGTIELNQNLKKYPEVHQMVLEHELGHARINNKHIDFMHDLKDSVNFKKNWMLLKFTLKHPSALLSFTPVFFEKGGVSFNWFMCLFWGFIILIAGGSFLI